MPADRSIMRTLGCAVLCGCAVASARPPSDAASGGPPSPPAAAQARAPEPSAPLIGRARMRDRVVDLTRESVAEGGSAHELVRSHAQIMADIEVDRSPPERFER